MEDVGIFRNKLGEEEDSQNAKHTVCFNLGKGSNSGVKLQFLENIKEL